MRKYLPYLLFVFLTLVILLPLFQRGFVFLLDMVWSSNMQLSDFTRNGIQPDLILSLILVFLNSFIPWDIVQKIIFVGLLLLPAITMYQLNKRFLEVKWAVVAGVFYMVNPYVYERFLGGQWYVLLGYGMFPLVVKWFLEFIEKFDKRRFLKFCLLFSVYPIISLHWAYIATLFLLVLGGVFVLVKWKDLYRFRNKFGMTHIGWKGLKYIIVFFCIFLIVNSFWLLNISTVNNQVSTFTSEDLYIYRTLGDPHLGVFFNVLSLYGFWQTGFLLPKDFNVYWPFLTILVLIFSLIGEWYLIKKRDILAITLAVLFVPIVFISVGYSSDFTRPIFVFFIDHLPLFKGFRDSSKFIGIIAFTYAFLLPIGVRETAKYLGSITFIGFKKYTSPFLLVIAFVIPLLMTNTLFWGFHNQLATSDYPSGWYKVNKLLVHDQMVKKVLFLPWYGYLSMNFAQNRTIANPAPIFFQSTIIVSNSLNNPDKTEELSTLDEKVLLIKNGVESFDQDYNFFINLRISHIIISKAQDFNYYQNLLNNKRLVIVYEDSDIVLLKVI
jgi:hypothetical protein